MKPYLCPVCAGRRTVSYGFYAAGNTINTTSWSANGEPCRTCGGEGIVWGPPPATGGVISEPSNPFFAPPRPLVQPHWRLGGPDTFGVFHLESDAERERRLQQAEGGF